MKFGPIKTKIEYYNYCEKLRTGNTLRFWNNLDDLKDSEYKGTVSIRNRFKDGSTNKIREYEIPQDKLENKLLQLGCNITELGFTEDPPNKHRTIQGEFTKLNGIPYLMYTKIKKPMFLAFKEEQIHCYGLAAINLLKSYTDPSSYEDIMQIMESFCDFSNVNVPTIEFSCFNICVGTIPNRNCILWEIRNY